MLRRFSRKDWYAFAGAEKFKDGSEPFIFYSERNGIELSLIGDAKMIYLVMACPDSGEEDMIWEEEIKANPIRIEGIMRHIIASLNLEGDWYAPDISYTLDHTGLFSV